MKKVFFQNSRKLKLAGNLFIADSPAIVIMAHGFCGDKSMEGRFDRIAQALNHAGYSVLAFDFSGCGESDDDSLTIEKEVDDLHSAICFAKARGYRDIALFGHSLGSLICLKGFAPEVKTMVLTGAVTDAMHYEWSNFYSDQQMQELRDKGFLTDYVNTPYREKVIISQQMLLDIGLISQRELLQHVACPVLIVHGNSTEDEEERGLLEKSKKGLRYLSTDSRLSIVDGADHRFFEHLTEVIELSKGWYGTHL